MHHHDDAKGLLPRRYLAKNLPPPQSLRHEILGFASAFVRLLKICRCPLRVKLTFRRETAIDLVGLQPKGAGIGKVDFGLIQTSDDPRLNPDCHTVSQSNGFGSVSEWLTIRPELSHPLPADERRNPGCHMYELPVIRPGGSLPSSPSSTGQSEQVP